MICLPARWWRQFGDDALKFVARVIDQQIAGNELEAFGIVSPMAGC